MPPYLAATMKVDMNPYIPDRITWIRLRSVELPLAQRYFLF